MFIEIEIKKDFILSGVNLNGHVVIVYDTMDGIYIKNPFYPQEEPMCFVLILDEYKVYKGFLSRQQITLNILNKICLLNSDDEYDKIVKESFLYYCTKNQINHRPFYESVENSKTKYNSNGFQTEESKDEIKFRKIALIGGFQDTRNNNEDFAITPYLFGVKMLKTYCFFNRKDVKVIILGLGLCWGYYSIHLSLGFNIPKNYPLFKIHKKKKDETH